MSARRFKCTCIEWDADEDSRRSGDLPDEAVIDCEDYELEDPDHESDDPVYDALWNALEDAYGSTPCSFSYEEIEEKPPLPERSEAT